MGFNTSPERAEGYFTDFERSFARYVFAREIINDNSIVLDVASGSGYGAYYLSLTAKSVIGIEKDNEAIKFSKVNFSSHNIKFISSDAADMSILEDDSVDYVVSFETIEHINNYHIFLGEVKRILKNNGFLIISTPNKDIASPLLKKPLHDFHVKEWTLFEFKELLSSYFILKEVYVQKFSWPKIVVFLRNLYAIFFSLFGQEILRKFLKILHFVIFSILKLNNKQSRLINKDLFKNIDECEYKKSVYFPVLINSNDKYFGIQVLILQNKK